MKQGKAMIKPVIGTGPHNMEFRHIPKTGGSSIEDTLLDFGIRVGRRNPKEQNGQCDQHTPERRDVNATTWCVIRDPLDRFVSEHKWQTDNKHHGSMWMGRRNCTKEALNEHVDQAYDRKLHETFTGHCHYLPQTNYDCDEQLLFSNLNGSVLDFAKQAYHVDISTLKHVHDMSTCNLTKADLTQKSADKLKEMYKDDFILFARLNESPV